MVSVRGRLVWALVAGLGSAMWGCSAKMPDRVPAPPLDPAGAAAKAIEMYGHDGVISGDALNKVPAFKNGLKRFSSGDGKVTAETITAELEKMKDSKVGLISLIARVKLDGADLEGAKVLLDPEPFMAGTISPASGITSAKGMASMAIESPGDNRRGANPGIYKVRITKEVNGQEVIPAKYNKDTELGVEISPDNGEDAANALRFDLKSH